MTARRAIVLLPMLALACILLADCGTPPGRDPAPEDEAAAERLYEQMVRMLLEERKDEALDAARRLLRDYARTQYLNAPLPPSDSRTRRQNLREYVDFMDSKGDGGK